MVGFLGLGARFESDSEPFLFLGSNRGWVLCFLVKDRGWGSEDEGDIFF